MRDTELKSSITDTLKDISKEDWDSLFGNGVIEGWGYHRTLEDAGLGEFKQYYLLIKRDRRLIAIIPFFTTDFSFTTIIQGWPQKIILNIQKKIKRFLRIRLLFIGTPTAEKFNFGIAKNQDLATTIDSGLKTISAFAKSKKIGMLMFYNLGEEDASLSKLLAKKGFAEMKNYPNTVIEITAGSLQEFISGLGPNTRKDLKKKLRNVSEVAELKTEVTDNIAGILDDVYRLYTNNFEESQVHFENLTPEFFKNIPRNMPGVAKYFITRNKGKVVAFNLCLVNGATCIDKFIGFDKSVAKEYNLYHASFCHNIEWCIKNGVRFYQMGITDYHPKIRLGAKLLPLYNYIKLSNPLLNFFARTCVKLFEPEKFDPTLKKLKA